jgi:hypothetical protein
VLTLLGCHGDSFVVGRREASLSSHSQPKTEQKLNAIWQKRGTRQSILLPRCCKMTLMTSGGAKNNFHTKLRSSEYIWHQRGAQFLLLRKIEAKWLCDVIQGAKGVAITDRKLW